MSINWKESDGTAWREEFKELKGSLSIVDIKLLEQGAQNNERGGALKFSSWRTQAIQDQSTTKTAKFEKAKRKQ